MTLKLPDDFIIGAATSSYQIEGGNFNSDWYEWEKKIKAADCICGNACKSWELYLQDIEVLKKFKFEAYRTSIEWGRIFKTPTEIDEEAVEHYVNMFKAIKSSGIKLYLTLQHHTLPLWLNGGWSNKEVLKHFKVYVRTAGERFQKYVDAWMPINEPCINNIFGYFMSLFPPGKNSLIAAVKVPTVQMKAHLAAYKILKEINSSIPIGFVKQLPGFKSKSNRIIDRVLTVFYDYLFNGLYVNSFSSGRLPFSIFRNVEFINSIDFWGLNYYTTKHVAFGESKEEFYNTTIDADSENMLGWKCEPEGLYKGIKRLWKLSKKPIFITENGIATNSEQSRIDYIKKHLIAISKAIEEGVEVRGYFYWSLLDNFEWCYGFKPTFGVVGVDRTTFERTPKESAYYLKKVSETKVIDL